MRRLFFLLILIFVGWWGWGWVQQLTAPPPPLPPRPEHVITIIEGWTIDDIDAYFTREQILPQGAFLRAAEAYPNTEAGKTFLGRVKSVEGYLFPDTYRIYTTATAQDIIQKATENFDRRLVDDIRTKIQARGLTIHEVVTLASIIEREVATPEDRRFVADIFLKRLDAGMALQADSTVNYITKKHVSRASLADTKIDSPYNTYQHRGLPPGPIGNPGLDTIRAVIDPTSSPYWYFLTTEDGRVMYAQDFEEHKENRGKYLQ